MKERKEREKRKVGKAVRRELKNLKYGGKTNKKEGREREREGD